MTSSLNIGFAGLGEMGSLIAERILSSRNALHVYNRTADKTLAIVERGAMPCISPAELAQKADIILLCLFDESAIEAVLFGASGIAEAARPGQLVADLSTTHPDFARRMSFRLREELDVAWVDAPVSGGPPGAAQGTLAAMAGGAKEDVDRLRPLFATFSSQMTHTGPAGCGQLAKACNQMVNFGNAIAIAEALNLAARCGMDPRLLPGAMAGAFSDSSLLRHLGPRMAEGRLQGNTFMTMKDLEIVLDIARTSGSATPVAALVHSYFCHLLDQGYEGDGIGGVARFYSKHPFVDLIRSPAEVAGAKQLRN